MEKNTQGVSGGNGILDTSGTLVVPRVMQLIKGRRKLSNLRFQSR